MSSMSFTPIPNEMFDSKELDPLDIVVYRVLRQLSYTTGKCFAAQKTIISKLNKPISEKTLRNSLHRLEKEGWIKQEKNENGKTLQYSFPKEQRISKLEPERVRENLPTTGGNFTGKPRENLPTNNIQVNNNKYINSRTSTHDKIHNFEERVYPDEFWESFGNG